MNKKFKKLAIVLISVLTVAVLVLCSGCGKLDLDNGKTPDGTLQNSSDAASSKPEKENSKTPSSQPAPSQDDSSQETSAVEKPEEKVYPVHMIGKTADEVKKAFGTDFDLSGYLGSAVMDYSKPEATFVLDEYVDEITGKEKIQAVIGYGNDPVYEKLTGKYTLSELKAAVANRVKLPEPEGFYNEMDEYYEYQVNFTLDGYGFTYSWDDDPESARSLCVTVYRANR